MKPILFSTPMVQAILDGRKTMTRRVIKWQKVHMADSRKELLLKRSPIEVGDVLWVRETWQYYCLGEKDSGFIYKASPELYHWKKESVIWKPSIFMPKEACRIFLRVTNVRVERLQDISEEDCLAEGIYESDDNDCTGKYKAYTIKKPTIESGVFIDDKFNSAYEAFEWLLNSINGKGTWEDNPYVFVYEFERVEKPKEL